MPLKQRKHKNINRRGYIKLKRFCKMKETMKKTKSHLLNERPYLQTIYHVRTHPIQHKQKQATYLKNGQRSWIQLFFKEEIQMTDRHIKKKKQKRSTSVIIREIHTKTTLRYHLTCVRMAIIKETQVSVGEAVEEREPLCTISRNVNWCDHYGKKYGSSSKVKSRTTKWSRNSTPGYL